MEDSVGSCHFKTTKGSAVGSLHALCVCKVNQNRSAFHLNAGTFWAFGNKLLAKAVSERLKGEALSDGALVSRMYVSFVSEVATYCHPSVGQCFGKATLTVAEVGPRMAGRDAAELHEVEGQFRFVKIVAPTLFEERKELFVEFYIVSVALTLVPNHTLWVQALQGAHTRIKKVVRHEGMAPPSCCAFPPRVAFEEGSGPRVLLKGGPGNRGDLFIRSMFKGFDNQVESPIDTLKYVENEKVNINIPGGFGLGVTFDNGDGLLVAADFNWAGWKGFTMNGVNDSLQNSWNIAIGGAYKPESTSISKYYKKITYRAGLHFDQTYYNIYGKSINKYGLSLGLGLPVPRSLTSFNVAVEIGSMGTIKNDLVKENYFNISISMSIHDRWFIKKRYQ